ncbi:hypothetical protein MKL29_04835 [Streptococcus suis]|nr:hypothetical protein [Streptococcus suis]
MSAIQIIGLILLAFSILKAIALVKVFGLFKPDEKTKVPKPKTEEEWNREEDEADDDSLF